MSRSEFALGLRRSLGSRDIALLTVGSVIGSGIFFVPGTVLRSAGGSLTLSGAAWIIGGLMALSGALTFAELGARRPDAGGVYLYIRDAFGRAPAFLFGWSMILAVAGGTVATLAVAFGDVVQRLFTLSEIASKIVAVGAILALTALNFGNARITALLQGASGLIKVAVLMGFAATIAVIGPSDAVSRAPLMAPTASLTATTAALVAVLWAYEGWHTITYCTGEMLSPGRVLPRGLVLGVVVLIIVYLSVNAACAYGLGTAGLGLSSQPVADALTAIGQEGFSRFVRIFVGFSILGAAHATFFTDSRVVYAMAKDGLFFEAFAKLSPGTQTPRRALLAIATSAIILTVFNAFDALLSLVVVSSWFFIGLAGASIFVFRKREGAPIGTFRVPLYPLLPALFVVAATFIVGSSWLTGPLTARYGLAVMIVGWIAYAIWNAVKSNHARTSVSRE